MARATDRPSRAIVLKNLDYLLRVGKLQEVRTLIFPGRDHDNEATVRYVAGRIGDACDYKLIRYRPFGVRETYRRLLGEDTTVTMQDCSISSFGGGALKIHGSGTLTILQEGYNQVWSYFTPYQEK